MKIAGRQYFWAAVLTVALIAPTGLPAQSVAMPRTAGEVPGPAAGTAMTKEYVQMVGRMAYLWGWPIVNQFNRRAVAGRIPGPGLNGGVIPIAPPGYNAMLTDYLSPKQNFVACPNQDVVYGGGGADLDKEPEVFQVPDFGDRFWVYAMYDARTDEFGEIGRQYGTKPGFYLIVGPNWKGDVPSGITSVVRCPTNYAFFAPRVFRDDTPEDAKAVQPLISRIMFYPLSRFDGKMKSTDWSKLPHFPVPAGVVGETQWVVPETYCDELLTVMKLVPPLPG
jgi:hypothetical protein